MRVDPAVSRTKYDRELSTLSEQRELLESRGVFVLGSSAYPIIEFLLVPKHLLRAVIPMTQRGGIVLPQGTMFSADVPGLSARAFRARFDLSDYDLYAPSIEFLDPWKEETLRYAGMFRAFEFEEQRRAHVVLLDTHPKTGKPFLCLRGVGEYHEHPQHSGDEWLLYRESMSVFSIVMSLWRAALDLTHAHLMIRQDGFQVQWTAEEKP